jgi:hypothetical protein
MSGGLDLPLQFRFGPAKLRRGVQIPSALLQRELCLHNDHVLRPADVHRLVHELGAIPVHPIEVPHPAQVARGETGGIRITSGQVFRDGHSGSLFRPLADQPTDLAVQLHLRHTRRHSGLYGGEQVAVVNVFSDVHGFLLPCFYFIYPISMPLRYWASEMLNST